MPSDILRPADIVAAGGALATDLQGLATSVADDLNQGLVGKADLVNGKVPASQLPAASNAVNSVNTKTGAVVINKDDVGLGNVDNTSDAAKPISDATATALATKANITDVNTALAGKADAATTAAAFADKADLDQTAAALALKANNTDLALKANILETLNKQTGTTYTLAANDIGKIIEFNNAAAISVTLPNSLPEGFGVILRQTGAGQVSLIGANGALLRNRQNQFKTAGQWSEVSISVRGNVGGNAAEYVISGDLVA